MKWALHHCRLFRLCASLLVILIFTCTAAYIIAPCGINKNVIGFTFSFFLSESAVEGPPRPPSPPLPEYKETAVFLLSSRRPLTSSSSSSRPLSSSSSSGVGGCEGGVGGPHWEDESTSSESKSRYCTTDTHKHLDNVNVDFFHMQKWIHLASNNNDNHCLNCTFL